MDRERWRQIDMIFKAALELPAGERAAFLERACAGDEALRAEVESLIAHDREGGPLEEPAFEEATRLLAAEREREQSLAGKIIGPYRIVSRIGAGGMGEVHLAVHERTGRKVALKLLPAHLMQDEQRVRRFQQEARAVLALNHPNIVTVYDIEQADGACVIASEFIEGETLRARIARGTLTLTDALDVAAQIAAALSAAHAARIVHRDIKPENVMLRPDGFVKVLDFGLTKLAEPPDTAESYSQAGWGRKHLEPAARRRPSHAVDLVHLRRHLRLRHLAGWPARSLAWRCDQQRRHPRRLAVAWSHAVLFSRSPRTLARFIFLSANASE
jgi:hypothetical protein